MATLLPAFASVVPSGPVALIEAGASAGLNLYPDRWGYAWSTPEGVVELGPAPYLSCDVSGPSPLPTALPEVAWRGGIDLNPLDVTDPEAMRWLETLIWPEDADRRVRLPPRGVAAADPPDWSAATCSTELPGARCRSVGVRHRPRLPLRGRGLPAGRATHRPPGC